MSRRKSWILGHRIGAPWNLVLGVILCLWPGLLNAGGSGLNVLIVANRESAPSVELANYYRTARNVPPSNVLPVSWPGGNIMWTQEEFTNTLLNPLLDFVAQNQLTNQIHYVVLSMDIPYRIGGVQGNSTTAALFYGYKAGTTNLNNSYAMSEARFPAGGPDTASAIPFLTMMLTGDTIEEAKRMIDQGVDGDHTFPANAVWLVKSADTARNIRYKQFDNAIFDSRLCGGYRLLRTNLNSSPSWTDFFGCQLGLASYTLASDAFIPGTIGDNLTSFGGQIFENPGQTTLLEFVKAGASGTYGTVTEPLGVTAKFPSPMAYFYQARGFSLAECYYQSVSEPFQGLMVGEPLSAPWSRTYNGGWFGLGYNALLRGTTNLTLSFAQDAGERPINRIDLFIDGRFHQTLTNIMPTAGNELTVRLNGYPVSYTVPTNATLSSIAAGLAAELNLGIHTNTTEVTATAYGDRIELQSFADPLPENVFEVVDNDGNANTAYLAAPTAYSVASRVAAPGRDAEGNFRVRYSTTPGVGSVLQASTNLLDWESLFTNTIGGMMEFIDAESPLFPRRFYRAATTALAPTPRLLSLGLNDSNAFHLRAVSESTRPYILQASPDRQIWSDVLTNLVGGNADYFDGAFATSSRRYYRTRSDDSNDYAPMEVVGKTSIGGNVIHVEDTGPSAVTLWKSTNGTDWAPIYTSSGSPNVRASTENHSGTGEALTTHLQAASPDFLSSEAQGYRQGSILDFPNDGVVLDGQYLHLSVTKTNGIVRTVGLTNTTGSVPFANFVQDFLTAVNAEPALTNADGLIAEDISIAGGIANFNLRARAAGRAASKIEVVLAATFPGMAVTPSSSMQLNGNSSDLLPRNHLYVSEGAPSLTHQFDLDTSSLPDGHHVLTAVAYEGTHVYSQTLKSSYVIVSNTPLQASLTIPDAGLPHPVNDAFAVEVSANAKNISEILLFTTGGFYAGSTHKDFAQFTVQGMDLGIGTHPFHALVISSNGSSYQTAPINVTITSQN